MTEAQEAHAERCNVTVAGLTAKLEKMFTIAEKNEQVAGGVSAVLGMAKLHGLITDKVGT